MTKQGTFLAAILVACGGEGAPTTSELTVVVDTVDAVVNVTNSGIAPSWGLRLAATIGPEAVLEAFAPSEFGRVSSVDMSPDGLIYVADILSDEVRVFDLRGQHVRTFGRSGEGPGEFGTLQSLTWAGDRLLTLDLGVGRVGEFSADGAWLGQRSAPGSVTGSPALIRFYPVGSDLAYAFSLSMGDRGLRRSFVGHRASGALGTVIMALEVDPEGFVTCEYGQGSMSFFTIPFTPRVLQHPTPDGGLAVAWTGEYSVAFLDAVGDTTRIVRRALEAEPVMTAEWEEGLEEFNAFREETPSASCEPRNPARPETKPFVEDMFLDKYGRMWVEVVRTQGNVWEVFDEAGSLLGQLPTRARKERAAPAFGREHLLLVREDSLGLDHVDVYAIDQSESDSS